MNKQVPKDIETSALEYADAMKALAGIVEEADAQIRAIKKKHLPAIKRAAERAAEAKQALHEKVKTAPHVFEKPRTKIIHGVKVGFRKDKGEVQFADEEAVIRRIRKLLPEDQAELLIRQEEHVHKPAVYDLMVDDLKRLGIQIVGDSDEVVVKIVGTDIEKLVDVLLKGDDENKKAKAA